MIAQPVPSWILSEHGTPCPTPWPWHVWPEWYWTPRWDLPCPDTHDWSAVCMKCDRCGWGLSELRSGGFLMTRGPRKR